MGTGVAARAASSDTGKTAASGAGAKRLADFIGYRHLPHTVEVERGRLRFFAKAIGETGPEFVDVEAARAMGYPDLVAPPTYAFSLELDQPRPFAFLEALGVRLERVLHGSQQFRWHLPICAGDQITLESQVEDVYEKKGGALQFIVIRTAATNQRGELAVEMTKTVVVRASGGKR
ncbi:MAG TPA: MaoC family dehydratase N-terminal domain-containing protein [Steroidobacter sp.]|uniref:MaoC family dehydratase N-terminal domain-containing protein n=1 Tax=Steroidobacter sp. TaxID=1978227 RepID=UPI002EDAFD06